MSPMMQPAPRPILRRRPAAARPAVKERPPETGRLAIVAACVGLAVGFVAIAILGSWGLVKGKPARKPLTPNEAEAVAARMLESGSGWFEGRGSSLATDRVVQAMATHPNLVPDHMEHRTKFVRFNFRVLTDVSLPKETGPAAIPVVESEPGKPVGAPPAPEPPASPEPPAAPPEPSAITGAQPPAASETAPAAPVPPAAQPPSAAAE